MGWHASTSLRLAFSGLSRICEALSPFFALALSSSVILLRGEETTVASAIRPLRDSQPLARRSFPEFLEELIEGADIAFRNELGEIPMHAASISDNSVTVETLAITGADLEARDDQDEAPYIGQPNPAVQRQCLRCSKPVSIQPRQHSLGTFQRNWPKRTTRYEMILYSTNWTRLDPS